MSTLESKLLDGPSAGYCSSSDGEEEEGFRPVNEDDDARQARLMRELGGGGKAGVKGVLQDYKDEQKERAIEANERMRELMDRAQKGMLTTSQEERDSVLDEDALEMLAIRERRAAEMKKFVSAAVVEFRNKELLSAMDQKTGLLVVLLYDMNDDRTAWATGLCRILSSSFPHVRVGRIPASTAGMSKAFVSGGVPCLQIYYKGDLVVSLVALHQQIGDDASTQALLSLLTVKRVNLALNRVDTEGDSDDDDI